MGFIYKAYRKSLEIRDRKIAVLIKKRRKVSSFFNGPAISRNKKFLIIGHPRCGTGYMASIFKAYGYSIGHEIMQRHGISSWTYVVENENPCRIWLPEYNHYNRFDFNFKYIIHVVRNPYTAIPSILYTEDIHPESLDFRKKYVSIKSQGLEGAIESYIQWNRLIETQKPTLRVQVENASQQLEKLFINKQIPYSESIKVKTLKSKKVNARQHNEVSPKRYNEISPNLKEELKKITKDYGYEIPKWFD